MVARRKTIQAAMIICLMVASMFCVGAQDIQLLEERNGEMLLQCAVSSYSIQDVVVNNEICQYVSIPRAAYMADRGEPDLPWLSGSVIIPATAEMGVEIVDIQYKELRAGKIAPSKGVIYRNQDPASVPYVFGEKYAVDAWVPQKQVFLGNPYIFRDFRGIAVYFQPVQYNPAQNKIRIAEKIVVKVRQTGISSVNVLTRKAEEISPTFATLYKSRFLNFSETRYPKVADGDKMAIICASKYKSGMEKFVAWKNQIGIETKLYDHPSETGGSSASNIKSFIQKQYDDNKVTYFLLVGDYADVTSLSAGRSESRGASDPSFLLLNGSDRYPDAFIGRLSVESASQLEVMVNKVLKYEQQPQENGDWYTKAVGIASNEGSPKDWEWMDRFRKKLMDYGYTEVDKLYDPSASASGVSKAVNDGRGWINYMGHGSKTSWGTTGFSNSGVSSLSNGDKLPVIISVACVNGNFSSGSACFAEAWTRKSNGGALIFLGSSINQAWTPPQHGQEGMVDLVVGEEYISAGAIIYNGESYMLEKTNGNDQNTFKTWVLFGDPSAMVYSKKPAKLSVTAPAGLKKGKQDVEVKFDKSIDGRVCFYSAQNGILGSKLVKKSNSVTVPVEVTNEQDVLLTVTARNYLPFEKELSVGTGIVAPAAFNVDNMKIVRKDNKLSLYLPFGKGVNVALTDLHGRTLTSFTTQGNLWYSMPASLPSGIHILTLKTENSNLVKKIQIIR